MSAPRRLRWGAPDPVGPRHVYRDTLLVYAGLALVVVIVALVTGGGLVRAIVVAGGFFILASSWSIYRLRRRERAAERARERALS
ncbi:MAG TPA: hypothetical protein VH538_06205 [Gaiellaceae bacterium]|jgi:Flp pilus assembly protein TadB